MVRPSSSRPPRKAKPKIQNLKDLVARTREVDVPVELAQGEVSVSRHGGLCAVRRAWDILGVEKLLDRAGIQKHQGVEAPSVVFLQTVGPLIGSGTVASSVGILKRDPAVPHLCGVEVPFGKDVVYRFLKNERFDFRAFDWARVERLQEIREMRFSHRGLLSLDSTLLRKTGNHFERIRPLYDHVTDSYLPAYDLLEMVYTEGGVDIPVAQELRTLTDEQHHALRLLKEGRKGFKALLRYASSASRRTPIFIRQQDFATAHFKQTDRTGLEWFAQAGQDLEFMVDGEAMTTRRLLRKLQKGKAFVRHAELGSEAAGQVVKLQGYRQPVKLFAYREDSKKSLRIILSSNPDLGEEAFQEAIHALRGDFGEDKIDLAIGQYRRLVELGCETRSTAFDNWFFVHRFCKELDAMGFTWFTQAGERDRFTVWGRELKASQIIERFASKAKKVRRLPGIRAHSLRASWPGFGWIRLVVVVKDKRPPFLLVTNGLSVPTKGIITSYKRRWRVEVVNREGKQSENLEGFRVRTLAAVQAHIALVFLSHTLLKLLALIDKILIDKSIGWVKENLINVVAEAERLKKKLRLSFANDFAYFYVLELLKCREARRKRPRRDKG